MIMMQMYHNHHRILPSGRFWHPFFLHFSLLTLLMIFTNDHNIIIIPALRLPYPSNALFNSFFWHILSNLVSTHKQCPCLAATQDN